MQSKKIVLPLTLAGFLGCALFLPSSEALGDAGDILNEEWRQSFVGDLPEMQDRHVIRVLVTHSKTNFFVVKGEPRGFDYELLQSYSQWLNRKTKRGHLKTRLVFIPVPFDQLLSSLQAGKGDIAASNLTITPARRKMVDFTIPYVPNVEEIIIARKGLKGLNHLKDLQNRQVFFVRGTSYATHVQEINKHFKGQGWAPIIPKGVGHNLVTEDLLELTNSGAIDLTVADNHVARLWSQVLPNIRLHPKLTIHKKGEIAWALRKNNPKLKHSLDTFLRQHKKGTLLGNILFKRYYQNVQWITNPLARREQQKLDQYMSLLKKYGKQYQFDWLLLAAQAYQESQFDHKKKSPRGAIGLMQVLPRTARNPPVNIRNIHDPEKNVHAAVKYLDYIRNRYFDHEQYASNEKINFTLAAYNAGPAKIRSLQAKAKKLGLNRYVWFSNMERVVLRYMGREPVRYVANIQKYYVAYRMLEHSRQQRKEELQELQAK